MGHAGSKSKPRKVTVSPTKEVKEYKPENAASFGDFFPLPHDLLVLIFSQLPPNEILTHSCVSKGIYSVIISDRLWKLMYEKRWGRGAVRKGGKALDWKVLYWKRATNNQDPREDPYWDSIMEHTNDPSLDADFAVHTWQITLPAGTSYRAFRVIQTGKNKYQPSKGQKDDWSDVFVVSGFEIFGYLSDNNMVEATSGSAGEIMPDGRRKFAYIDNNNRKGIINGLGGYPTVQVYASSLSPGKSVEGFISNEDVYIWTKNERYSWFAVDLGKGRTAEPTHYMLRYGSGGNYCCPRSWLLQGTNTIEVLRELDDPTEDPKWDTLSVHTEDSALDSDWAVHTWSLKLSDSQAEYRAFRIIQTGKNKYKVPTPGQKDSWSDVLVASGFELYGSLYEKGKRKKLAKRRSLTTNMTWTRTESYIIWEDILLLRCMHRVCILAKTS